MLISSRNRSMSRWHSEFLQEMSVTKLRVSVTFFRVPGKNGHPPGTNPEVPRAKKSATDLDLPCSEIHHWPPAPPSEFPRLFWGPGKNAENLDGWEIEIGGRFLGPQNFRICSGWVPFFSGHPEKSNGHHKFCNCQFVETLTIPATP